MATSRAWSATSASSDLQMLWSVAVGASSLVREADGRRRRQRAIKVPTSVTTTTERA